MAIENKTNQVIITFNLENGNLISLNMKLLVLNQLSTDKSSGSFTFEELLVLLVYIWYNHLDLICSPHIPVSLFVDEPLTSEAFFRLNL